MKSSLRKVVMSKQVAKAYLDDVSKTAATLTVYFQNEGRLRAFMTATKESFGSRMSCTRGFDYVSFLSTDASAMNSLKGKVIEQGLDFSD